MIFARVVLFSAVAILIGEPSLAKAQKCAGPVEIDPISAQTIQSIERVTDGRSLVSATDEGAPRQFKILIMPSFGSATELQIAKRGEEYLVQVYHVGRDDRGGRHLDEYISKALPREKGERIWAVARQVNEELLQTKCTRGIIRDGTSYVLELNDNSNRSKQKVIELISNSQREFAREIQTLVPWNIDSVGP